MIPSPERAALGSRILAAMTLGCWVCAAGCGGPRSMPPDEALEEADRRVNALLGEGRDRQPAATATNANDSGDDTLKFWYYDHPLIAPAFNVEGISTEFKRLYPGIDLEARFIGPWPVAVQKLTVSMVAGDLPDAAMVDRSWFAQLVYAGRAAPLDDILPASLIEDLEPAVRDAMSLDGTLFGMPTDGFCSVLVYDPAEVKTPPSTWDELLGVAAGLRGKLPGERYPMGYYPFFEGLWSVGGVICDRKRSGLNDPPAHEALRFLLDLRDRAYAHPRAVNDSAAGRFALSRGLAAMTVSSTEFLDPKTNASKWAYGPVPGKDGPISALTGNAIVVFAPMDPAKAPALAALLDYLTGASVQGSSALERGSVPVRRSVADKLEVPPGLAAAMEHARATPLVPSWGSVEFEIARHLQLAAQWKEGSGSK